MSRDRRAKEWDPGRFGEGQVAGRPGAGPAPGKRSRTESLPVQRKRRAREGGDAAAGAGEVAARGVAGSGTPLPYRDLIQRSFGRHDIRGVRAHTGGAAADASDSLGAVAYATGNDVAFGRGPNLHTAAHEAAHVVQQRSGVQLASEVGEDGDAYERHADAVADAVVAGRSAEGILDRTPGSASSSAGIQLRRAGGGGAFGRILGVQAIGGGANVTIHATGVEDGTKILFDRGLIGEVTRVSGAHAVVFLAATLDTVKAMDPHVTVLSDSRARKLRRGADEDVPARMIGLRAAEWGSMVTISRGSESGVEIGADVDFDGEVLGGVMEVRQGSSLVFVPWDLDALRGIDRGCAVKPRKKSRGVRRRERNAATADVLHVQQIDDTRCKVQVHRGAHHGVSPDWRVQYLNEDGSARREGRVLEVGDAYSWHSFEMPYSTFTSGRPHKLKLIPDG